MVTRTGKFTGNYDGLLSDSQREFGFHLREDEEFFYLYLNNKLYNVYNSHSITEQIIQYDILTLYIIQSTSGKIHFGRGNV